MMTSHSKAVALEVIENLFALVWIIASIATLYLLVAALTLDGSWSHVGIAVLTGAVGKWLAKSFHDVKLQLLADGQLLDR